MVAWIFIVFSGFAMFASILQNIMFAVLFPYGALHAIQAKPGEEDVVAIVNFIVIPAGLAPFGWIAKRLLSPEVRREFVGA